MNDIPEAFYLTAVTPLGPVSRLGSFFDVSRFDKAVLLKGGTSRLRARLLALAADEAEKRGFAVKRVLSPERPGESEAVFWNKTAILDSCYPCCIEPEYPSVFEEILWLGECFDGKLLKSYREDIIQLKNRIKITTFNS